MPKGKKWTRKQRAALSRAQKRAWKTRRRAGGARTARAHNGVGRGQAGVAADVEFWQSYIDERKRAVRALNRQVKIARSIMRNVAAIS